MRLVLKLVLPVVAAALFLLPNAAYAQTGSIAGQARDQQGGALPGVTVEVTSPALIEKVRSTVTDENGRYQITALPVGTYEVTFKLESFAPSRTGNVVLTSDFTANVVAEMKVGQLTDSVNVTATAQVVDIQNARVSQTFQGDEVRDLPVTRDIPGLMLLVPSLTVGGLGGTCSGGVGVFCNPNAQSFNSHTSGLDTDGQAQGRIMVDGMVINAGRPNTTTGQSGGIVLDPGNAQEVTFTLSGSLGESETGGASINIVPRTGGNRFAGNYFTNYTSARWFDRNRGTRLAAQATQSYLSDYTVNGSYSGPVLRDRLWFYAYGQHRGSEQWPGGADPGYINLNEGLFASNYLPDRSQGRLTYRNEYKNADLRLTWQASQKNKVSVFWSEQDSCTNPCYGQISVNYAPETYFTLQTRPNHLAQARWTNPYTNRVLFEAGVNWVATHFDTSKHREFTNYRQNPTVCELGPTVGGDAVAPAVNSSFGPALITGGVGSTTNAGGTCPDFSAFHSGSLNWPFPGDDVHAAFRNYDQWRATGSASYITGSHNAKIGFDGFNTREKANNVVNDLQLSYGYNTPSANCTSFLTTQAFPCGNTSLYNPEDPRNTFRRPVPAFFQINTGVGTQDEQIWAGALYVQDQWTLNRLTVNAALRYDHAQSQYNPTCIGPNRFVPTQADGRDFWCTPTTPGAKYDDITPRWGVAWDVFGNGKTSVKWNMGKYLGAAGLSGLYVDANPARRSVNFLNRAWTDDNGNRIVDCAFFDPAPHSTFGDTCGSLLNTSGAQIGAPSNAFLTYGKDPIGLDASGANAAFFINSICGRTENSSALHQNYCADAGQNLLSGSGVRRAEWQFGLGVQHELLPRLSVEVTYNRREYSNLTDSDTLGQGCDYFNGEVGAPAQDVTACGNQLLNYQSAQYDFYSVDAPIDPRLPNGGGYRILGNNTQKSAGTIATYGSVTTIQKSLAYSWNGVDTNFVLRARGGLRISGGTSTGRSVRDTCYTDVDVPAVKSREGNNYAGGCRPYRPFQTNVRANASYTIPWVDILAGMVFQYRPGVERSANLAIQNTDVSWMAGSEAHANQPCVVQGVAGVGCFNGGTAAFNSSVNLLDTGDIYGEGLRMTDLKLGKNIRFGRRRVNLGLDIYNVFNSDAATTYNNTYTAFRQPDGSWGLDNPATPAIENTNNWGVVTGVTTPRFARFQVQFDF